MLFPQTDGAAAVVLARLQTALRAAAAHAPWPLTVSLGAVVFTEMPATLDEMIPKADAVMYEVKNGGKNAARLVAE